jgi:hypothetical protein
MAKHVWIFIMPLALSYTTQAFNNLPSLLEVTLKRADLAHSIGCLKARDYFATTAMFQLHKAPR